MNKTLIFTPIIALAVSVICYVALGRFSWWVVAVFFLTAPVITLLQYLLSRFGNPKVQDNAKSVSTQAHHK
ncbi:MAG: hypothetical protein ABJH45_10080 [Paracoccaceae bacterium]